MMRSRTFRHPSCPAETQQGVALHGKGEELDSAARFGGGDLVLAARGNQGSQSESWRATSVLQRLIPITY